LSPNEGKVPITNNSNNLSSYVMQLCGYSWNSLITDSKMKSAVVELFL
jgi:hypothetical protein